MIELILPGKVVSAEVLGEDPAAYLLPEEEYLVARAVASRRREVTISRTCARRALAGLGYAEVPVGRGPKREPVWPEGVVGSITHRAEYCAAAVASTLDFLAVGIDAEPNGQLPSGVFDRVSTPAERAALARLPDSGVHWDRLLFSAKESVYKAWFPLTRRWLGFQDAELRIAAQAGEFHASLLVEAPEVDGRRLTGFSGRFLLAEGFVLTAVTVAR